MSVSTAARHDSSTMMVAAPMSSTPFCVTSRSLNVAKRVGSQRSAAMFAITKTPIVGVIENMAYFPDPATGEPIPIFGRGGAAAEAVRLGVPLLAEIPIDMALRQGGDEGRPVTAVDPDGAVAKAFAQAARALA